MFIQKKKKDDKAEEEEVLDWWTRFYETLRDMEDTGPKKKSIFAKAKEGEKEEENERAKIPRIKVSFEHCSLLFTKQQVHSNKNYVSECEPRVWETK